MTLWPGRCLIHIALHWSVHTWLEGSSCLWSVISHNLHWISSLASCSVRFNVKWHQTMSSHLFFLCGPSVLLFWCLTLMRDWIWVNWLTPIPAKVVNHCDLCRLELPSKAKPPFVSWIFLLELWVAVIARSASKPVPQLKKLLDYLLVYTIQVSFVPLKWGHCFMEFSVFCLFKVMYLNEKNNQHCFQVASSTW